MNDEEAKAKRREIYKQQKALRDQDPQYLALKERAKQQRREQYRIYKEKINAQKNTERLEKQQRKDEELKALVSNSQRLTLIKFDQD